jgi:hypothetical protein
MFEDLQDGLRRMVMKEALKRLREPSLAEVFAHPEKWRIVRITNHGLEVEEIKPKAP